MAALGQTISGVAHELNNPLATILSWAERLAEKIAGRRSRRGVDVILGEAERAARIVRNLLTFARKRQSTRDDDRPQPGRARDAGAARLRAAADEHRGRHRARGRAAAGLCRRPPDPAGAAQPGHQRRTGDGLGPRPRLAGDPDVARRRARRRRARSQRRRPGRAGGDARARSSTRSSRRRRSARARASA